MVVQASAVQSVTHETVTASFVADPYSGLMPLAVSFTNTSTGNSAGTSYDWNLGNGMTYTTTNASTVYNTQGNYLVILTATDGFCVDTASRIIKVDLVSFFTVPNVLLLMEMEKMMCLLLMLLTWAILLLLFLIVGVLKCLRLQQAEI